jgi:hypothetical protein
MGFTLPFEVRNNESKFRTGRPEPDLAPVHFFLEYLVSGGMLQTLMRTLRFQARI